MRLLNTRPARTGLVYCQICGAPFTATPINNTLCVDHTPAAIQTMFAPAPSPAPEDYAEEADRLNMGWGDLHTAIHELDAQVTHAAYLTESAKRAARAVLAGMANELEDLLTAMQLQDAAQLADWIAAREGRPRKED